MLSRKKKNYWPYILIVILFTLVAFIYTVKILPQKYQQSRLEQKIFDFKAEEVSKIEIILKGENRAVLTKNNDEWLVDSSPTDTEEIQMALVDLANFSQTKLISSNEAKFGQFEVNAESGLILKLFKNNDLKEEIIIGKIGPSFSSNYVRNARDKKVYLVNKNIGLFWSKMNWQKAEE